MIANMYDQIKKHEGFRSKPYKCIAGKTTIGWGRNLDDVGISKEEAEILLNNDISRAHASVEKIFVDPNIIFHGESYIALVDMMFNLGETRFRGFKKMIKAIEDGDWEEAANQAKDSKWYNQVGKRGKTIVEQLKGK